MNKELKNKCSKCQNRIQEIDKVLQEFKEHYGENMPTWYQEQTKRLEQKKLLLSDINHKETNHE